MTAVLIGWMGRILISNTVRICNNIRKDEHKLLPSGWSLGGLIKIWLPWNKLRVNKGNYDLDTKELLGQVMQLGLSEIYIIRIRCGPL